MQAIQINSVSKRYGDLLAVDCIDLDIQSGEVFGLIGPNGAGKSTLVNMMCGVVDIDKGEIHILGSRMSSAISAAQESRLAKRHLGVVPQEIALFDQMTVMQNLSFFSALYGLKGKLKAARISEALDLSQLHDKRNKKVKTLSGGMKRRLNLVCSMLHHPSVLVLDEPTVGIDPHSRNHIFEVIQKLNKDRCMTIIYITHYMEEVESLCDRIAIIDGGQVKLVGTKDQIIESVSDEMIVKISASDVMEGHLHQMRSLLGVRFVNRTDNGVELIFQKDKVTFNSLSEALHRIGLAVSSMSMELPSLENAFLQITGKALRDA